MDGIGNDPSANWAMDDDEFGGGNFFSETSENQYFVIE